CGSGVSATVNFMLMEEAGLEPKLYPGSFSDWISYEENEVESDF
ncbi:MAG: sulfurtransferase, partial [Tissierellia bacterium]|nr:sulfurtransferase [Tissierellia bacterium]